MPLVRAFPLVRPREEFDAFVKALSAERSGETARFYKHYGITHESVHLQETAPGAFWVIAVTKIDQPEEAAARYADASEDFHMWFKNQVLHLSGIDPTKQPLGPPTTRLFSWSDDSREGSNLCA
ncbi:MAG: hypothetical protein ABI831_00560 [Betaproteobacteria bacterium]